MGKPADYGPILNGVMWFQVVISSVFIALRIYTRYYIIRNIGWDDLMMIVNLVSRTSSHIFGPLDLHETPNVYVWDSPTPDRLVIR